jgi:predicted HicB family RNase H-like nuclease
VQKVVRAEERAAEVLQVPAQEPSEPAAYPGTSENTDKGGSGVRAQFIYALCDPDTKERRYVGVSVNPKSRFSGHRNDPMGGRKKHEWVTSLKNVGKKPELEILENCGLTGRDWRAAEKEWIKKLKSAGNSLLNVKEGGTGKPPNGRPPKKHYAVRVVLRNRRDWQTIKRAARDKGLSVNTYILTEVLAQARNYLSYRG